MNKNISYLFRDRFKLFFWVLILLLLPFIFSTQLIDEDNFPKLLLVAIVMTILSARSIVKKDYHNWDLALLIIVVINVLYFIFSFLNSDIFSNGITALLVILLPPVLLLLIRSNKLYSEMIYFFIPLAALILCCIAIVQFFIMHGKDFQPVHMIRATMSNKNFLSECLVMYLVFCISGLLNMTGGIRKLNLVAIIFVLLTILILQSISAYVCLVFLTFSAGLVFLIFSIKKISRTKVAVYVGSAFVLLILAGIFITKLPQFHGVKVKLDYASKLITGAPLPEANAGLQNSIYERLYLWRNSLKIFDEKPATGIGLADWQIYWPKYGMYGASYLDAAIMRYEHPHNEYILMLAENGIFGLVCYAAFFLYIFYRGLKIILRQGDLKKRQTAVLMLSGISCLSILCLFGYPLHRPYTIVLAIIMCMVILELGTENQKSISAGRIIPVFLLLFSLYSTVVFANRISGEYNFSKALSYQARGNFVGMLRSVRNAGNKYYTTDNSSTPLDWYKGFAMFYQGNDSAMYYYQRAEEQNPYHVQTISDIGALLENQGKHEEAIKYFNRVLAFVPNYYQAHYNLAVAYFNLGRMPEALHEINARFVVGDEYLNTRDVILARSAELIVDSCDKTGKTRDIATNKLLLRKINDQSLEVHTTFGSILCDTISHRLRRLPG